MPKDNCKKAKAESFDKGKKVGFFLAKKFEGESKKKKIKKDLKLLKKKIVKKKSKKRVGREPRISRANLERLPPQGRSGTRSLITIAKKKGIRVTKSRDNTTRKRKETLIREILAKSK